MKHIGNGSDTQLYVGQTLDDLTKVLHRHHSLGAQNADQSLQVISISDSTFDPSRRRSDLLNAAAITLHHLVFHSCRFDLHVNGIAGIVNLQIGAVFPMRTICAMLRINPLNTIDVTEFHMMTLVPGLPTCLFTALFALALGRWLFITVSRWRLAAIMAVFMKHFFQFFNPCFGFFKLGGGFFQFNSQGFNCLLLCLKCFK